MSATVTSTRAAFFDVDETLIAVKSMFAFLRFWLASRGDDGTGYRRAVADLEAEAGRGADRAAVNRAYYRLYTGALLSDLLDAGEAWYTHYRRHPSAFVSAALAALVDHRRAGDAIVLVSGSFRPCLLPVAAHLGAHEVLCTEPDVAEDGRLTGVVRRAMIGEAKAEAIAERIAALELTAAECHCYGDHASDLRMLLLVGHPVVVGCDPILSAYARRLGWPQLAAGHGPGPEREPR